MAQGPAPLLLHASCVSVGGRAVLIKGASGSGKSALALQLIAMGAELVSDDQTELTRDGTTISARAPDAISGLIEARGVGLIRCPVADGAVVAFVVDMDRTETKRLPEWRGETVLDTQLPCLHKVESPHFPAAVMAYLKGSRKEPHGPDEK